MLNELRRMNILSGEKFVSPRAYSFGLFKRLMPMLLLNNRKLDTCFCWYVRVPLEVKKISVIHSRSLRSLFISVVPHGLEPWTP
jgi:hypothetical protein